MSPRWFAVDTVGQLAVFEAEHISPTGTLDPEAGYLLTLRISRHLRVDRRPVPGEHVKIRGGTVLTIATPEV